MSLYGDMRRRDRNQVARNKKWKSAADVRDFRIAQRIAKIALPKKSYNWMRKAAVNEFTKYGDFGMATPSTQIMEESLAGAFGITDQEISNQMKQEAHSSSMPSGAQLGSGFVPSREPSRSISDIGAAVKVDNAYRGPDQSTTLNQKPPGGGLSTSVIGGNIIKNVLGGILGDEQADADNSGGHAYPEELQVYEGDAPGSSSSRGRSWQAKHLNAAPSLAEILGSGLLTPQQIAAASFGNVYGLFRLTGSGISENMKREMTFYMQRMILEGYNHGVDLVRLLKGEYRSGLEIRMVGGSPGWAGLAGAGRVNFATNSWNNHNDAGRLRLFYHEMGHELLKRSHVLPLRNNPDKSLLTYSDTGNSMTRSKSVYDHFMNEFFRFAGPVLGSSSEFNQRKRDYTFGTTRQNTDVNAILRANPGWFPSVTGAVPNVPQPPGGNGGNPGAGPGRPPPPIDPDVNVNIPFNPSVNVPINFNPQIPITFTPNIPITFNTVNPVQVDTSAGGGSAVASGGMAMGADAGGGAAPMNLEHMRTPVLPPMPNIPNLGSFAAGLAELAMRGEGSVGDFRSALANLKSG